VSGKCSNRSKGVVGLDDKVFLNMTTAYLTAYTMSKVKCPVDAEILRLSLRVTQRKRNENSRIF
jgi:hypothetical protein